MMSYCKRCEKILDGWEVVADGQLIMVRCPKCKLNYPVLMIPISAAPRLIGPLRE